MDVTTAIARLRALDPTGWGHGLSAAAAEHTWRDAVDALTRADLVGPVPGAPPRRVLLVASANVYVAPLPWIAHLAGRGVEVRVKPARGQLDAMLAIASCFPGVTVTPFVGGDLEGEAKAMRDVDGVLAFGTGETLAALGARVPRGVVWVPFGPRYGISIVDRVDDDVLLDHVLFDGRGCMSPAGVFLRRSGLDEMAALLDRAEALLPRGPLAAETAAAIRARVALARAVGQARVGEAWAVVELPPARFTPIALPRLVVLHPAADPVAAAEAAVRPWAAELGTVASRLPLPPALAAAPRVCAPGEMQRPGAGPVHEGIDVLARLWGAA